MIRTYICKDFTGFLPRAQQNWISREKLSILRNHTWLRIYFLHSDTSSAIHQLCDLRQVAKFSNSLLFFLN